MHTIKTVVLFVFGAVILASAPAIIQQVDATDGSAVSIPVEHPPGFMALVESQQALRSGDVQPSSRGLMGAGEVFPIAASAEHVEADSSVAYGGGRFAVAYSRDGNIVMAFVSESGVLENTFLIDDNALDCSHPEVAYEGGSGLFVVVWHCDQVGDGSVYDTWVAAVSPSIGRIGDLRGWTTVYEKMYPAVACNPIDESCLIAVEYNRGETIQGVYVGVGPSGIVSISDAVALIDSTNGFRPHLAWGRSSGTYLLAYTWQDVSGEEFPFYSHVTDTWSATPFLHSAAYAVDETFSGGGFRKSTTDVAFDPCTEKFLIVFEYDWAGNQVEHSVLVTMIHATDAQYFGVYEVASTIYINEYGGVISFISGDPQSATCHAMDKLVLAYRNDEIGVLAVELQGNHNPLAPAYTFDPETSHHIVAGNSESESPLKPSIAGGSGQGRVLVTFTSRLTNPSDNNVWGKMLTLSFCNYLPVLIR